MKIASLPLSLPALLLGLALPLHAEKPEVPEWALPGSATHKQVPPPADFHRATKTFKSSLGIFEGQSDIGGAVVPGNAKYNSKEKAYTIESAGYNIWYTRDEFRYLWKKVSGDVSLATDIHFPDTGGYDDRKVVLVIRQDLDDDSKEVMGALHRAGLVHLAERSEKSALIKEDHRIEATAGGATIKRLGIEKHGDEISLFASEKGEPMHLVGRPATLHFDKPFYVGIGFCSHLPDKTDTAVVSNLVLETSAGKVR